MVYRIEIHTTIEPQWRNMSADFRIPLQGTPSPNYSNAKSSLVSTTVVVVVVFDADLNQPNQFPNLDTGADLIAQLQYDFHLANDRIDSSYVSSSMDTNLLSNSIDKYYRGYSGGVAAPAHGNIGVGIAGTRDQNVPPASPTHYALVVGIGNYDDSANFPMEKNSKGVPYTIADARAINEVLVDNAALYGPPQVLENPTAAQMIAALYGLADKARKDDTVMLFYAGHGVIDSNVPGSYFLTAADTRINPDNSIDPTTAIDHTQLVALLNDIVADNILMLFNSCFSGNVTSNATLGEVVNDHLNPALGFNTTKDNLASIPRNLAVALSQPPADLGITQNQNTEQTTGKVLITACASDQESWVGTGDQTIFTTALYDALKNGTYVHPDDKGYISVFDLYIAIQKLIDELIDSEVSAVIDQDPIITALNVDGNFPVAIHPANLPLPTSNLNAPVIVPIPSPPPHLNLAGFVTIIETTFVGMADGDPRTQMENAAKNLMRVASRLREGDNMSDDTVQSNLDDVELALSEAGEHQLLDQFIALRVILGE